MLKRLPAIAIAVALAAMSAPVFAADTSPGMSPATNFSGIPPVPAQRARDPSDPTPPKLAQFPADPSVQVQVNHAPQFSPYDSPDFVLPPYEIESGSM